MKNVVEIAMFRYSDGTFSKEPIQGKTISGIVGYVERNFRCALCISLQEAVLPWSSDLLSYRFVSEAVAKKIKNAYPRYYKSYKLGVVPTNQAEVRAIKVGILLRDARKKSQKIEALHWCFNFTENGLKQGQNLLPDITRLEKVLQQADVINLALEKIGQPKLSGSYWSLTEANYRDVWFCDFDKKSTDYSPKTELKKVRAVFWVKY